MASDPSETGQHPCPHCGSLRGVHRLGQSRYWYCPDCNGALSRRDVMLRLDSNWTEDRVQQPGSFHSDWLSHNESIAPPKPGDKAPSTVTPARQGMTASEKKEARRLYNKASDGILTGHIVSDVILVIIVIYLMITVA